MNSEELLKENMSEYDESDESENAGEEIFGLHVLKDGA